MEEFGKEDKSSGQQVPANKRKKKIDRILPLSGVPEVMDIKELSSYLGIGKSKIYALINSRKIPASKIGRQYRFYKVLVDKWLQEKLITIEADPLPLFEPDSRRSPLHGK